MRCGLHISNLRFRSGVPRVGEQADNIGARDQFAQHSQPFCPECVDNKRHARDIAAGTVETRNETEIDRVRAGRENDRNGCGCSFGSHCSRRGEGNDRIYGTRHQIGGQCRQAVEARIGRAIFDCEIAPFDIAGILEALPNGADLSIIQLSAAEQADQRHDGLLRARRARPQHSAAEHCDEVAPFQSITSSARSAGLPWSGPLRADRLLSFR